MTTDRFNRPFAPLDASKSLISVGAATASVALKLTGSHGGRVPNIRVFNNGTATAWFAFGGSGVVAVIADDVGVGAGMAEVFTLPDNETDITHVAAIALAATGNIEFSVGYGI